MPGDEIAERQHQSAPASAGNLRDYDRLKLELAGIIRSLRQMAENRNDRHASNECRNLLSRLAEDRFNLVVVGQFSRGKTSLMNAMLGVDRLPTSVLPLTSVITSVSYGDRERVLIHWHGWSYTTEIALSELPRYVTQEGNPGNQKRISCAEVQLPVELLRLGFYFIDTPGVGSAIAANTATTSEFLPEADAVIFVTSFESPLAEAELQFLDQVRRHVRKIFVIVNKRDLVPSEQQDAVTAFIEARLKDTLGEPASHVYSISARDALSAKLSADAESLHHSGLPHLEADLLEFLQKDKTREFLWRVTDRASAILSRLSVQFEVIQELAADNEKVKIFEVDLNKKLQLLHREHEKIGRDLKVKLGLGLQRHFEADLEQPVMVFKSVLEQQLRRHLDPGNVGTDSLETLLRADAQVAAQRISAAWFDEHKQELQQLAEDSSRNVLRKIEDAIVQLETPGANVAGAGWLDSSVEARFNGILRGNRVAVRGIQPDAWDLEIPWWVELLAAFPPMRAFVVKRCLRYAEKLVPAYRHELVSLLERSGDDWIEDLERRLKELIEDVATAQRQILEKHVQPEEVDQLKRLRERLEALTSSVNLVDPATDSAGRLDLLDVNRIPRSNLAARCKICHEVEAALFEFMRHRQYELSTNEKEQISHAEQGGFCGLHTWQYEEVSSPQGVCSAYPPVLIAVGRRLRSLAESTVPNGELADEVLRLMPNGATCRACLLVASVELCAVTKLVATLCAAENGSAPLPPLCLRHLYSVLRSKPGSEIARRLIEEQARTFDRFSEDMQRYAIKHDALRRELATELEHRVHEIALSRLVGLRNIVAPWKVDEI